MPHSNAVKSRTRQKAARSRAKLAGQRHTVALPSNLARQVARYAEAVDTSMSKAIATLVRVGLESQESRKQVFFRKLKENLANDDPREQDRLVDEFRTLILGR